jgi:hypothetical protein
MKYRFHPGAQSELEDTVVFYNRCQEGLGLEFAIEVYHAIQNILRYPLAWSSLSRSTRRCLLKRFPYGVIYQHEFRTQ